jgi:DNA polymerase elongation subunit (family B)
MARTVGGVKVTTTPAKIVFIDIETAPSLGWVWGKWEQNVIDFKRDWYILSFAYKVAGEKKIVTRGLIDYAGYRKDIDKSGNDEALVQDLWKVFDEADILIGHNGDSFDIRKANSRFLVHKLPPPTLYKTVDTLKIARRSFKFDSNKLDDLGRYLGVGRKLPNTGFNLWKGCMQGDAKSWKQMKEYNKHDVELLEKVYYLLRAWAPTHPNVNKGENACPKCASFNVQKRGFSYTLQRQQQRFQCLSCRGWYIGSARKAE